MLTLLYFILILGLIVLVHEFGHFIFAKMFGVYVYEFSIGMGPKIIGTKPKKGKTAYNLRALPIGGFVQLAGEDATEEDKDIPKGSHLYEKPIWQRFLIMFFGAGNNFILALILLFMVGLFHGAPVMDPVITNLDEAGAMYTAGIKVGDIITEFNGKAVSSVTELNRAKNQCKIGDEATIKIYQNKSKDYKEIKVELQEQVIQEGESTNQNTPSNSKR